MALEKKSLASRKAAPSTKNAGKKVDSAKLVTAKVVAPRVVTAKIWVNS